MFTITCCLVVGLGLGLRLKLDLVSGCAHVFVLLTIVIFTLPQPTGGSASTGKPGQVHAVQTHISLFCDYVDTRRLDCTVPLVRLRFRREWRTLNRILCRRFSEAHYGTVIKTVGAMLYGYLT